jgi:flavin reductase (DIM6/NTAB) family NADH-FMN oxidoreductase RutF
MRRLWEVLEEAETFVLRMPTDKVGLLFLKNGRVLQPEPDRLAEYQTHAGHKRGQWPSSVEISGAMLERYRQRQ